MSDCDNVEIVSSLPVDDLVWKPVEVQPAMEPRTRVRRADFRVPAEQVDAFDDGIVEFAS